MNLISEQRVTVPETSRLATARVSSNMYSRRPEGICSGLTTVKSDSDSAFEAMLWEGTPDMTLQLVG